MSSTKREPLHDEVLEAEHFYNAVPVGLCVLSRDLRYLRVNERLAQIHGRPAEDHIGRTIEEVLPTVAPTLAPLISRVLETSQPLVDLDVTATTPGATRDATELVGKHLPKAFSGRDHAGYQHGGPRHYATQAYAVGSGEERRTAPSARRVNQRHSVGGGCPGPGGSPTWAHKP